MQTGVARETVAAGARNKSVRTGETARFEVNGDDRRKSQLFTGRRLATAGEGIRTLDVQLGKLAFYH